ncbi:hypothetical protein GCM10009557_38020 [Virgisporangium ochraceum]
MSTFSLALVTFQVPTTHLSMPLAVVPPVPPPPPGSSLLALTTTTPTMPITRITATTDSTISGTVDGRRVGCAGAAWYGFGSW